MDSRKKTIINRILLSLLGNENLVDQWWNSPNRHWNQNTPFDIWISDPDSVYNYVLGQLNGDYS